MAFSKQLEDLIEAALADGVITDKERSVLHKKALLEGVDPDEVDMILQGRLAKTRVTPSTEKRGNIVKCPNCGAPIEAGAVKCNECGYVFTNIQANSTAKEFANELDKQIAAVSGAADVERVNEYIKNYPLPTAKEEMLEFIASLDARRRSVSKYQSAYGAKYKECINKAKVQFAGDPQIHALLAQTGKFSFAIFTKTQRILGFITILVLLLFGWLAKCSTAEKEFYRQGEIQSEKLCALIDELPNPTQENYKECEAEIFKIKWTEIQAPFDDVFWNLSGVSMDVKVNSIYYSSSYKSIYLEKKQSYMKRIYSIYKQIYGDKADDYAPHDIVYSDLVQN